MSVDLNVWSSHSLRFDSYKEGIRQFEEKVSKRIKQWDFKSGKPLVKTNDLSKVEYFTNFEILEHNFDNWNQIRIWTNFEYCDEIQLFKKVTKLEPTRFWIRYSKWKELVVGNFEEESGGVLNQLKEARHNWLSFRKFCHSITEELNGDKVIYLNDNEYQIQEDKFHAGQSLEEVIELLNKVKQPCELELFELFPNDIRAKNAWHYDDLKKFDE